jgi:hypothetical protein
VCRPATCHTCGKATYKGCGQHVEQVLKSVSKNQRCTCTPGNRDVSAGSTFLARILRR